MRVSAQLAMVAAMLVMAEPACALDPAIDVALYGRRTWRVDEGLPHSSTQAIAQTPDGYLWLGTQSGIARFDGVRFDTFNDLSSPTRGRWITAVVVDANGTLWAAGTGTGLLVYRGGKFHVVLGERELRARDIFAMAVAPDGGLWMGTDKGLVRLSPNGALQHWMSREGSSMGMCRSLLATRNGDIWIGTELGVIRFSRERVENVPAPATMPRRSIRSLYEDSQGRVWVGTNEGAYSIEGGRPREHAQLHDISTAFVTSILEDSHHNIWFGTNMGLKRLAADGTGAPLSGEGLISRFVLALFEDREHTLWVGTLYGVVQLRETLFKTYGTLHGLRDEAVHALVQDADGAIWLGTFGGLGRLHDGDVRWWTRKDGLPNDVVLSMSLARGGGVWIGTYGSGVCHVGDSSPRCWGTKEGLTHGIVTGLVEDEDGGLWIGTLGGGINYLRHGKVTAYGLSEGLPNLRIAMIARARRGGLWVGTIGSGLFHFQNGRVTRRVPLGDRPLDVRGVLDEADGTLWVGIDEIGFAHVKDDRVTLIPLASYVENVHVHSLIYDGVGGLWASTRRSLLRFDRTELIRHIQGQAATLHPRVFGPADGFNSIELRAARPSALISADGSLWVGGTRGLARIDPRSISKTKSTAPTIIVQGAEVDGRSLSGQRPLVKRGARVAFRYTAIHFTSPEDVVFRYKLEGYDDAWIDAGRARSAVYANLPPGRYTFRVAATTAERGWSGASEGAFDIQRQPMLFERRVVHIAGAILLLIIVMAIYRVRVTLLEALNRQLSRHNQMILDSAGEGILGLDWSGVITFINPAGAKMLGVTVEQLVGTKLHSFIHPAEENTSEDECLVCRRSETAESRVSRSASFRTRTGTVIPVEFTAAVIASASGTPTGVVVTYRDVTERLAVERMKSEFVSTVSHELRTPLTSIRGSLGLLAGGVLGNLDRRAQRMLDIALTNTDRLVRLINAILDLERIDAGRMQLDRKNVSAEALVNDAVDGVRAMADEAGVSISTEVDDATLVVDRDRIVQTLTNLLSNAIKFSPRSSAIALRGITYAESFTFSVTDRGRGIPSDHLERIFERFQQVDASDSRDKGGSGLGLAICRSIVEAHGGRIWAERNEGCGAIFRFTVPLRHSNEQRNVA